MSSVCDKHKYADCHLQSFAEIFGVRANPVGFVDDFGGSWKTCSAIARGFALTLLPSQKFVEGVGVRGSPCKYRSAWVPQWFFLEIIINYGSQCHYVGLILLRVIMCPAVISSVCVCVCASRRHSVFHCWRKMTLILRYSDVSSEDPIASLFWRETRAPKWQGQVDTFCRGIWRRCLSEYSMFFWRDLHCRLCLNILWFRIMCSSVWCLQHMQEKHVRNITWTLILCIKGS